MLITNDGKSIVDHKIDDKTDDAVESVDIEIRRR